MNDEDVSKQSIIHTFDADIPVTTYLPSVKPGETPCLNWKPTSLCYSSRLGLFIFDQLSRSIRNVKNGIVSTVVQCPPYDVSGVELPFDVLDVQGMCISKHDSLLVCDTPHHVIKEITLVQNDQEPYGFIKTFAGKSSKNSTKPGFKCGLRLASKFNQPSAITCTMWGDILISDTMNHSIRVIREDKVSIFANQNGKAGLCDGPRKKARFNSPTSIKCSPQCDVVVCDTGNKKIRLIDQFGNVSTLAGCGNNDIEDFRLSALLSSSAEKFVKTRAFHDGAHLNAAFYHPTGLVMTHFGDLIVSDKNIRFIQINGIVSTLAQSKESYDIEQEDNIVEDTTKETLEDEKSLEKPVEALIPSLSKSTTKRDQNNKFKLPGDIVINDDGDLLFCDPENNKIQVIQGAIAHLYPYNHPRIKKIRASFDSLDYSSKGNSRFSLAPLLNSAAFSDYQIYHTQIGLPTVANKKELIHKTYNLHQIVLYSVCPALLDDQILIDLQKSRISSKSLDLLFEYIYKDSIIDDIGLNDLCDFEVLARKLNLSALAQNLRYRIYKNLVLLDSENTAIDLIHYVYHNCGNEHLLIDCISEFLATKRNIFRADVQTFAQRRSSASSAVQTNTYGGLGRFYRLRSVKSAPDIHVMLSEMLNNVETKIANHGNKLAFKDMKLHEKNKVNIFGQLQSSIEALHVHLRNTLPAKSLVPFHDILQPDLSIRVKGEFIPCHGSVVYGRWPYIAKRIDQSELVTKTSVLKVFLSSDPSESNLPLQKSKKSSFDSGNHAYVSFSSSSGPSSPSFFSISPPSTPHFSLLPTVSLPQNSLTPAFVTGLIWYLYSNEIHRLPNPEICLEFLQFAPFFGFVDSETNMPCPPFEALVTHIQALLIKPLTIDNCFLILKAAQMHGYEERAEQALKFINEHYEDISLRIDLLNQYQSLKLSQKVILKPK